MWCAALAGEVGEIAWFLAKATPWHSRCFVADERPGVVIECHALRARRCEQKEPIIMFIITLFTLLATLIINGELSPTDRCDIVYSDTGRPIFCEPHSAPPRWDAAVCCSDAGCVPAKSGACSSGLQAQYCELGKLSGDGSVRCYFEVPDYCDVFDCEPSLEVQLDPQAYGMCCPEGGPCWPTAGGLNDCEVDDLIWCNNGCTNPDGTTTCFDDEE
jgi:hypothetical protein